MNKLQQNLSNQRYVKIFIHVYQKITFLENGPCNSQCHTDKFAYACLFIQGV